MSAPKTPKAVAGVRSLRERLEQLSPVHASVAETSKKAESFCRSVRADLRSLRKQRGIDQTELAKGLDMSQSAVSKVETGSGDLGLKTLHRFADALGFRPVVLLVPSHRAVPVQKRSGRAAVARSRGRVGYGDVRIAVVPEDAAAIEDTESKLLRQMSVSVAQAMANLAKKE